MKFLQIVILAAVLVASAHALKCYEGNEDAKACTSKDQIAEMTVCVKCKVSVGWLAGACKTPADCGLKEACSFAAGTYSECTTDNCNTCSL